MSYVGMMTLFYRCLGKLHVLWWRLQYRTVVEGYSMRYIHRITGKEADAATVRRHMIRGCRAEGWRLTGNEPKKITFERNGDTLTVEIAE